MEFKNSNSWPTCKNVSYHYIHLKAEMV